MSATNCEIIALLSVCLFSFLN